MEVVMEVAMEIERKGICRKCLTRDMDKREYFENLHKYIVNLEEDIKVEQLVYERRLAVCQHCELLMDGMCRACGCYVELRAAMRVKACPYEKWRAENA
ncbi:DUF6171 family protein [Kineothrix sp. MB12-C1]|uniref:DUF6171 family protein n=1 Tax=Kineothrix sp. MB12-C1 TaxID=3070215 RepID=UPI0027D1FDA5|nr:DUF6171 family protein [Kineothrix sp. MB12-C1]WMC91518.1 DUF6171 family protein [Kineothrix sp. MB12-C1]